MLKNIPKRFLHLLRSTWFFFFCLLITALAHAQQQPLYGFLLDSAGRRPIANASISNKTRNKTVVSGENGFFTLNANDFDLIFFTALGYKLKTFYYDINNKDTLRVFLSPLPDSLANVTVRATGYNQYQLDSIRRKKGFVADAGPKMKAVAPANSGAGIGLNLDAFFKKKEHKRREAYGDFDDDEKQEYINYRFSMAFVQQYTGLKDDELLDFMYKYTPTYKWLRKHLTDEDIVYYINDKLKEFYGRDDKKKKKKN